MNKYPFLKNLEFEDIEEHIEIFCGKKYKDYYIRGQAFAVPDLIYTIDLMGYGDGDFGIDYFDEKGNEIKDFTTFVITIFTLVNDVYQERLTEKLIHKDFGKREFKFFENSIENFTYLISKYHIDPTNKPINIKNNEIKIKENSYLNQCIMDRKDIILYDIDLDILNPYKNKAIKKDCYSCLFPILTDFCWENIKDGPPAYFRETYVEYFINHHLPHELFENFDCVTIDQQKYWKIIDEIGNLGYKWEKEKININEFIKLLNLFNSEYEQNEDPLVEFCYSLFAILINKLISEKRIKQCPHCCDFFQLIRSAKTKNIVPKNMKAKIVVKKPEIKDSMNNIKKKSYPKLKKPQEN